MVILYKADSSFVHLDGRNRGFKKEVSLTKVYASIMIKSDMLDGCIL